MRALWIPLFLAGAACGGRHVRPEGMRFEPSVSTSVRASFSLLGNDITRVDAWHYELANEPSPTKADLHAVIVAGSRALAFGDGGTILVRVDSAPWTIVPSPTHERLRGASSALVAVGDHGTWLTERSGTWTRETSGTESDLYAVASVDTRSFAVGDHGVLVERTRDGHFSRIDTRTQARLRGILHSHDGTSANHGEMMDDLYLVGDGGTIVDCTLRLEPPVCIPRASPTEENLVQVLDAVPASATFKDVHAPLLSAMILGAEGTLLGVTMGRTPPYEFVKIALRMPAKMTRIVAPRAHFSTDGKMVVDGAAVFPPLVAVGAGGRGALSDGQKVVPFELPNVGDLNDLATGEIDVFAVGDGGVIVHGAMHGATEIAPVMGLL